MIRNSSWTPNTSRYSIYFISEQETFIYRVVKFNGTFSVCFFVFLLYVKYQVLTSLIRWHINKHTSFMSQSERHPFRLNPWLDTISFWHWKFFAVWQIYIYWRLCIFISEGGLSNEIDYWLFLVSDRKFGFARVSAKKKVSVANLPKLRPKPKLQNNWN